MLSDQSVKLEKVDKLLAALEKVYPSAGKLIWRSFLQGVFVGLGATIGVSIIIAILTYSIGKLKLVPVFRNIIIETNIEQVLPKN